MRIKRNGGYVLHAPLSFIFQVVELGGAAVQKYSSIDDAFSPDRSLTPYVLKPELKISDPDKNIPTGDYTSRLVNVMWTVTLYQNGKSELVKEGADTYQNAGKAGGYVLTFNRNLKLSESIHIEFSADYYDEIRKETTQFTWDKWLNTIAEDTYKTSLQYERQAGKIKLYPFKDRGNMYINVQLLNGDKNLDDKLSVYLWEKWENNKYVPISEDDDLWYVSGKDSKSLVVEQKYINKVKVRVTAYPKEAPSQKHYKSYFLKRYYGQWDDDADFTFGKYISDDTTKIGIEASVQRAGSGGDIHDPQKYFEVELFYRKSASAPWQSLGYSGKAVIERPADAERHEPGIMVRQLTALQPIELPDGTILCDDEGKPIVGQFPVSSRDVDEEITLKDIITNPANGLTFIDPETIQALNENYKYQAVEEREAING